MTVSYIIPINHPIGAFPSELIIKEMVYTIVAGAIIYKILDVKFRYKAIIHDSIGFNMLFTLTLDRSTIVNPSINLKTVTYIIGNEIMAIYDAFRT